MMMMGPYGKGAGKSGLICFANVVSLDFFFKLNFGMSFKQSTCSTFDYFEVEAFHIFSLGNDLKSNSETL